MPAEHNLGFSGGQSDKSSSKPGGYNKRMRCKHRLPPEALVGICIHVWPACAKKGTQLHPEMSLQTLPPLLAHTHKNTPKIQKKNTHAQVICWGLAQDRIPGASFRLQLLLQHSLLKSIKNTFIVLTTLPSARVWPSTLSYTGKIGKECLEGKKCEQLRYWQRNKHKYSEFYCH